MADAAVEFTTERPVDLPRTLFVLRRAGAGDPTIQVSGGAWTAEAWRATRTPEGPGTERIRVRGRRVTVEAWGPGAAWLVGRAPELVGEPDAAAAFRPTHPVVRELWRRMPGVRIPRTSAVLESLVPSVFEQKVPGAEARAAYARLLRRLGEPAPGPAEGPRLLVPPAPERLASTPYQRFHAFGVDRRRAETARRAASYAGRLEELPAMPPAEAYARLTALPGVGPWTAAETGLRALGDADAVPLGDYHLPHAVAWALAGRARADDALMLELLEPFRPFRALAFRLILMAGFDAPRRGPRLPLNGTLRPSMPQRLTSNPATARR